jgi:orotidine-5'-phosphate decarboxylase
MSNAADRLCAAVARVKNPTALGLDTQRSHLPAEFVPGQESAAQICGALLDYNRALIDGLADLIGVVKVQAAYYERYGVEGMAAFSKTLRYARQRGYVTIADCKRNDIGATASAYAAAYLDGGDFAADFVTVNPYLGEDGIGPFIEAADRSGGGIFVLVKTSNPSGGQLQDLDCGGSTLYERVADLVSGWGKGLIGRAGYSSVGAVVGATWPAESADLRRRMPHTPFLVPGYGAQGATGADLAGCFDAAGGGAVINASRSLLCAHHRRPDLHWLDAARAEAERMRGDILGGLPAGE